jgi:hypothetical protein
MIFKFWEVFLAEVFDSSTYMRIILSGKCVKRERYIWLIEKKLHLHCILTLQ